MMRARNRFKISIRSVVPKKKKSTHFHLDHLCTFACLIVSMSAQSVGGDEISVFSPAGTARAAAIPVGALEAGDLVGETPKGKKARYAEEEFVKKTLGSNLEKTMLEDLKRVASKFNKLTKRRIRTREREKYQSLVQQVQQIQRWWNVPAGVTPFSTPESEELDNQARVCGTLVLEPEGTWRDMKKSLHYKFKETSLAVDASMASDQNERTGENCGLRIVHERMSCV